jgi:hypothetical protein
MRRENPWRIVKIVSGIRTLASGILAGIALWF